MVVQVDGDNSGAWDFHCHILWHSATGFGIDIFEDTEEIQVFDIPNENYQQYKDWNASMAAGQVVQIDPGACITLQ
jgi:hypothetical protein